VTYRIRFTEEAQEQLDHLCAFLVSEALVVASEALAAISHALTLLERFPFSCRKAADGRYGAFAREFLVSFGRSGCVLLFKISDKRTVTVACARQERQRDYY
jgi:plasmid stabilization system protein ParE